MPTNKFKNKIKIRHKLYEDVNLLDADNEYDTIIKIKNNEKIKWIQNETIRKVFKSIKNYKFYVIKYSKTW